MSNQKPISQFTLIEVVIAIAILAMTMVAMLGIVASSAKRMGKAMTNWEEQHMLTQAAEYYLLAGPNESIPDEFFPFAGYKAECVIEDPQLPGDVEPESGNWRFVTLKISVYKDGVSDPVDSIFIDQILRKEDVE